MLTGPKISTHQRCNFCTGEVVDLESDRLRMRKEETDCNIVSESVGSCQVEAY